MPNDWPVFHESWWLDAVAGSGNWGECVVEEKGKIIARLPWCRIKKNGLIYITTPPITPFMGPWFRSSEGNTQQKKISIENRLTEILIKNLPNYDYFNQGFDIKINNWQQWYWMGYSATPYYTYRYSNLLNLDNIWAGMSSSTRNDINHANKSGILISENVNINQIFELLLINFKKNNIPPPFSRELLIRLDNACKENQARKVIGAYTPEGRLCAVAYLVHNSYTTYNLINASDITTLNRGAMSLVLWESIKYASTVSKNFDFEGSMIKPVERFYRNFGGELTQYYQVERSKNILILILSIIKEIKRLFK
jgi:hypothetical protein